MVDSGRFRRVGAGWLATLALAAGTVAAQEERDITDLDLAELAQVEIATGTAQPITRAPAVATVITAAELEAMGITHLDEALEAVPGLHVVPSTFSSLEPIYSIRGIVSETNAQVLVLIDGVAITQLLNGGRALAFRLPVANVSRIEVIRGPGSAVYGADAFAGVINVITKTAGDVDGVEIGTRVGSFASRDAWVLYGGAAGGWDLALSAAWQSSDSDLDRIVSEDLQTRFDRLFGTRASLAPGPIDTRYEVLDLSLKAARGRWDLGLWRWSNQDRGVGAGIAQALDPAGDQRASQTLLRVTYHHPDRFRAWDLRTRWSSFYLKQDAGFRLFPPGARLPIGSSGTLDFADPVGLVRFPDGVIGTIGDSEETHALETTAIYDRGTGHRVRLGAGVRSHDVDTRGAGNTGAGVIDGTQSMVDGTLTDLTDTPFIFMQDQEREEWFLLVQDEWTFAPDWELTAGLRFDHYSDFGSTLNPRLALVWETRANLTTKLLYGSAFRAPSFGELFAINNPVSLGNPNLEPEEIDTLELAIDCRPRRGLRTVLSLFTYEIDGLIALVPDDPEDPGTSSTARNAREQRGYGVELETDWRLSATFRLRGHVAWQRSEDQVTGARIADAPGRQLYVTGEWRFLPDWSLAKRLNWVMDRRRAPDDPRPAIDDYAMLDLTLRRQRVAEHWDFAIAVKNVFDEKAREPSGFEIPNDYPLAQRSFFVETRYRF